MHEPSCGLYLITPLADRRSRRLSRRPPAPLWRRAGVEAFQVRIKDVDNEAVAEVVSRLRPLCRAHSVTLILNDRPDLAAALDCDGVHVGQGDAPLAEARRLVGGDRVVGVTCHDSRHLAMEAAEGGADYVAFGAFLPDHDQGDLPPARSRDPGGLAGDDVDPLCRHRRHHATERRTARASRRGLPGGVQRGLVRSRRTRRGCQSVRRADRQRAGRAQGMIGW